MDLLEYQGKQLFARHGVPVPSGSPATTVEEAVAAADEIGYPCVVKAQVQIGGRGKAGGIKVAQDRHGGRGPREGDPRHGHPRADGPRGLDRGRLGHRRRVLRLDRLRPRRQAPAGDALHPGRHGHRGGRRRATRHAIARLHVDPLLGFQDFHARRLAFEADVDADVVRPIGALLTKLYDAFVAEEAMLVEVNPLIVTGDRQVTALDAKVTLDDSSLFRHADNAALRASEDEDPQERMARERGLTYVKLDGNVGILGNGAGLVMSTLDVVAQAGGSPANFLDAGGGSKAEAITSAVEVILSNPNVTAVLFNIFGGITRCDEVAKGLIEAFEQIEPDRPLRGAARRHQRQGGPRAARAGGPAQRPHGVHDARRRARVVELAAVGGASRARCRSARAASRAGAADARGGGDEHPRRQGHEALRLGHHRARGHVPRDEQPALRDAGRLGRDARQGRPGRRGRPGVQHLPRRGRRRPAPTRR